MALEERLQLGAALHLQLGAALHERQIEQGPAIGRRWFASAGGLQGAVWRFVPMQQMSLAFAVHKFSLNCRERRAPAGRNRAWRQVPARGRVEKLAIGGSIRLVNTWLSGL